METAIPLVTALSAVSFLLGFLIARNTWLTFEGRQMRRDMRTILNQRAELERVAAQLREQKKRYAALLGNHRAMRRAGWRAMNFGPSLFRDPTLIQAHKLREQLKASYPEMAAYFDTLAQAPLGMKCWKGCGHDAELRIADTPWCKDCYQARDVVIGETEGGGKVSSR